MRLLLTLAFLLASSGAMAEVKYFPEREELCLGCHGMGNTPPQPGTPWLGGIPEYYALLQLVEFRDGNRESEAMRDMVHDMTDDDLYAAAAFVDQQPRPGPPAEEGIPEVMKKGAELSNKHLCNRCHGSRYLGGKQMPPLRNQREDYLLKALKDYKAERRMGNRAAMVEVVQKISDEELQILAHYLAHVRD